MSKLQYINVHKKENYNPNTQIHDQLLFSIDTATSIESGGVKLILWAQASPLSEIMRSCIKIAIHNRLPFDFVHCQR
jgi:hypothetical protein